MLRQTEKDSAADERGFTLIRKINGYHSFVGGIFPFVLGSLYYKGLIWIPDVRRCHLDWFKTARLLVIA
jgi:hypothetical protein